MAKRKSPTSDDSVLANPFGGEDPRHEKWSSAFKAESYRKWTPGLVVGPAQRNTEGELTDLRPLKLRIVARFDTWADYILQHFFPEGQESELYSQTLDVLAKATLEANEDALSAAGRMSAWETTLADSVLAELDRTERRVAPRCLNSETGRKWHEMSVIWTTLVEDSIPLSLVGSIS